MTARGIVFVDVGTTWHRCIAEALGEVAPTIAFLPKNDALMRMDPITLPDTGVARIVKCGLPRGWASSLAGPAQALMARRIRRAACLLHDPVVVLPSPAYAPLSSYLRDLPLVYYGADDYGSYAGWPRVLERERAILTHCALGVFVSDSLAERAVAELGLHKERAFVSPNATEQRFADNTTPTPEAVRALPRPIIGVLGALSPRLDLEVLEAVATLPKLGTLLVAGPLAPELQRLEWLAGPKVHVTGRLPHTEMHAYARAMDAALIPYGPSALNYHCSPMRLWDHLATGVPIFALDTCDQIVRHGGERVTVDSSAGLPQRLASALEIGLRERKTPSSDIFWRTRAQSLVLRLTSL
ncbi:hypothetical protein GCM10011363_46370 [Marivita lacus]|uniref:Glycosyltransferase n=1 Tax=Marivita lacus TaxID=1323742 RepID=A0ABQ1LKD8_9RHOB|nr:hypothetical protein [Marivita lacus]GGC24637.1 hypothetical protein GCM10011363_46370 [Marivita lacus]